MPVILRYCPGCCPDVLIYCKIPLASSKLIGTLFTKGPLAPAGLLANVIGFIPTPGCIKVKVGSSPLVLFERL